MNAQPDADDARALTGWEGILSKLVARPTGTVTFLFTDIEARSHTWEVDASAAESLVASHDKLARTVLEHHQGYVFSTMGDGFGVAFQRASDAVAAAVELHESFTSEVWASKGLRVRMGVHIGRRSSATVIISARP